MTPEYSAIKGFVSYLLLVYLLLNKKKTRWTFYNCSNSIIFAKGNMYIKCVYSSKMSKELHTWFDKYMNICSSSLPPSVCYFQGELVVSFFQIRQVQKWSTYSLKNWSKVKRVKFVNPISKETAFVLNYFPQWEIPSTYLK